MRVLEGRLAAAGRPMTAAAGLETLATCRYEPNELLECDYSVTQATQEQATILRPSASARSIGRRQINQGSRP